MFPLRFDPETIDQPHLLTIRYSHFCELGRWAMDHSGLPYTEVSYAVGCHMDPVGSLREDPSTWSESSYAGVDSGEGAERRRTVVPLVCLPGGRLLRDSWEILSHFVAPIETRWMQRLDQEIGPACRRFAYRALLDPTRPELVEAMAQGITEQERVFWDQASQVVMGRVSDLLGLSEAREAEDRKLIQGIFEELSGKIDTLPAVSVGAEAMAWWIALSSLAALAVFPPQYGGSAWEAPPLEGFDPERQEWVRGMRETRLGRAVLAFYAEHRA